MRIQSFFATYHRPLNPPIMGDFKRNLVPPIIGGLGGRLGQGLVGTIAGTVLVAFPSFAETVQTPDKITIAPQDNSQVPADGRSRIPLAGQVLDKEGKPFLETITVTLTSSDGKFIGADQDADRAGFQALAINGEFSAELQSSLNPKSVTIRAAVDPPKRSDKEAKLPA
jgi:hypothetical protein